MTCKPREISEDERKKLHWTWFDGVPQSFCPRYNADQRIKLGVARKGDVPDVPFTPHEGEIMPYDLRDTNWDGVNFSGKNVKFQAGTDIRGASFVGSDFRGLNLLGLIANCQTDFNGADFRGATIDEDLLEFIYNYDEAKLGQVIIATSMGSRDINVDLGSPVGLKTALVTTFAAYLAALGLGGYVTKDGEQPTEPLPKDPAPTEIIVQQTPVKPKTALSLTETGVFCGNANAREDEEINEICEGRGFTQEPEAP